MMGAGLGQGAAELAGAGYEALPRASTRAPALVAIAKVVFDRVESLKPAGELLGH